MALRVAWCREQGKGNGPRGQQPVQDEQLLPLDPIRQPYIPTRIMKRIRVASRAISRNDLRAHIVQEAAVAGKLEKAIRRVQAVGLAWTATQIGRRGREFGCSHGEGNGAPAGQGKQRGLLAHARRHRGGAGSAIRAPGSRLHARGPAVAGLEIAWPRACDRGLRVGVAGGRGAR